MSKKLDMNGNDAIGSIQYVLSRHYALGPAARTSMRHWLDEIEKPVTYSNEDIDRASGFYDFLTDLVEMDPRNKKG